MKAEKMSSSWSLRDDGFVAATKTKNSVLRLFFESDNFRKYKIDRIDDNHLAHKIAVDS